MSFVRFLTTAVVLLTALADSPPFRSAAAEPIAARGYLHLNGYTRHFSAPDANDALYGLGWTWYTQPRGRLLTAFEADIFEDSGRKLSAYIGYSWTATFRLANLGVTGALMRHRNFSPYNHACLLPVALPYGEFLVHGVKLRAYYVPPIRRKTDHQVAFQLMVPLLR